MRLCLGSLSGLRVSSSRSPTPMSLGGGSITAGTEWRGCQMSNPIKQSTVLAAGGIAALLAGACCLGPLALVSIGIGGGGVPDLFALEASRALFFVGGGVA